MAEKRVLIVDVMHLAYKAAFGGMPALSATVKMNGQLVEVQTTIPSFLCKTIFNWSKGGYYPTVVCFDTKTGNIGRNAYFKQFREETEEKTYKAGRKGENDLFYQGCDLAYNLLLKSGVCCLKAERYEADDLIKAAVDKAKVQYPDLKIDIITGDVDLVPLVDDQVSVFLSSRKTTYAEDDNIKKNHYVQITPSIYQEYMESLTNYKTLYVPYNTILLAKLLRGDKSDGIEGYPKFTPTKYKNLISAMLQDGVDLSKICRYDANTETICYLDSGEPIPADLIESTPKENKMMKYGDPKCLTELCETLSNYLDEDIINHVRRIYRGINLNTAFTGLEQQYCRRPVKVVGDINGYDGIHMRDVVGELKINLSTRY